MRTASIAFALLLLLGASGVSRAQPPDMSSLWPNADGLVWTYDQFVQDPAETTLIPVSLRFNGTIIAAGGTEAQNLVEEIGPASQTAGRGAEIAGPLLRNLWRARPDLRVAIEARTGAKEMAPAMEPPIWEAILLHGGAFQKNDEQIINLHVDFSPGTSWIYLVSDLTIGNTFMLQLIPDVADNVFLHGTIAAMEEVTVPAGTYSNCVRVDYTIDYGESECVLEGGSEPQGMSRSMTQGSIHYAPNVGPVRSFEEFIPYVEGTDAACLEHGFEIGEVAARVTLTLTEAPVPVVETTWGRMKQRYE